MNKSLTRFLFALGTVLLLSTALIFAQTDNTQSTAPANPPAAKKPKHVYTDADFVSHDDKCAKLTDAKERSDEGCTPLAGKDDDASSSAVPDESLDDLKARLAKLQEENKNFIDNAKKWQDRIPNETDESQKQMYLNLVETNNAGAERTAADIKDVERKIARLEKKQPKPVAAKKG